MTTLDGFSSGGSPAGLSYECSEQVSNDTRANFGIFFDGKIACFPERPPDFAIDDFPKGDNGLLSIPL